MLRRPVAFVLMVSLLLGIATPAAAIIEASSSTSSLRFPATMAPAALVSGNFTVLAWVWPEVLDPGPRAVFQVPGAFELRLDGPSSVSATVRRSGATPSSVTATAALPLRSHCWTLVGAAYSRSSGTLTVFAYPAGSKVAAATVTEPAMSGLASGPITGEIAIGSHPQGLMGVFGAYGPLLVRNHWIGPADFAHVATSRRYWAAFDTDTMPSGGLMNGATGCAWMVGHAMTTVPQYAGGTVGAFARAAVVGKAMTEHNVHVFDRAAFAYAASLRVVFTASAALGFTYRSHMDPPYAGWFVRDLPPAGMNLDPVPATAPKTRQLITGPREPLRVMISGNSRSVGGSDGSGDYPGNFMSGFVERNRARVSGVLFRSAHLVSGGNPWFGFDSGGSQPVFSPDGSILTMEASSPVSDFVRLWSGSGDTAGPGTGLFLIPGGYYALKCKPEPGSLLLADQPLVVEAYVLRFPGASPVTWRPVKGAYQADPGEFGPPTVVPLDTTSYVRVLGTGDSVPALNVLVLAGDVTGQIIPGQACYVRSGPGHRSFSTVNTVSLLGPSTIVTLSHPLRAAPAPGSELRFGAWEFQPLTHVWPALGPGDPLVFRGLEVKAGLGAGVAVFAFSAWRPNVNGFHFGAAGWSGNGYGAQISEAFPGSHAKWMALTGADVWIETPAQQNSEPPTLAQYGALVRQALPGVEVVWASEMTHGETVDPISTDAWAVYIQEHAAKEGAVGLVSAADPTLGTWFEQLSDGLRMDPYHICQRGNHRQADVWTEMLKHAAIDPCLRADLNFDGQMTVADFGAFQTLFVAGDPLADFNGDGQLTIQDFGAFQTYFVQGC